MNARVVLTIAGLTLREASRRRLLIAVVVLTAILIGVSAWGFDRITELACANEQCSPVEEKTGAAILVVLITFMYSFVFAVGAVFVAAPAIAEEAESGVLLAVVPRPIRRSELVLGKWLGIAALIGGYALFTTGGEFLAVRLIVGYSPPHPYTAIAFLLGECFVMLTLALLFSTRLAPMTGGIIALVLFGLSWMGGVAHGIGIALGSEAVQTVGRVTRLVLPADGLWRGALYNIQPLAILEEAALSDPTRTDIAANPFITISAPSATYLAWSAVWVVVVLGLAVLSFRRREL